MTRYYLVGVGGAPIEAFDNYDTLADAQAACLSMAEGMAEDGEDVESYEGTGEACRDGGVDCGGACPDGEGGGYWPCIIEIKEGGAA